MTHYDVIVAGGGTAGAMAAIAAARNGAKTLVVERFSHLGGTATYGIPILGIVSGNGTIVNRGMVSELIDRLKEIGMAFGIARGTTWNTPEKPGAYEFSLMPFDPEGLKFVLQEMACNAGVDLLYYSLLTGVSLDGNRVRSIEITNKSGRTSYSADIFIDCTGDADLVGLAGGAFLEKQNVQNSSILFRIGSVDLEKFHKELERGETIKGKGDWHTRVLFHSKADGAPKTMVHMAGHFALDDDDSKLITFTAVSLRDGEIFLNATRVTNVNATDMRSVTEAELIERRNVMKVFQGLKRKVQGFENAVLLNTSALGIRESRNILGEYIIEKEDVLNGAKFPDTIAHGAYPIDIHDPKGGKTQFNFIRDGGFFSIPYRSLLPKELEGMLVAGRCISASHHAHGAVRIMGCVLAQGEAAGTAAALCANEKILPRQLNVNNLQKRLSLIL